MMAQQRPEPIRAAHTMHGMADADAEDAMLNAHKRRSVTEPPAHEKMIQCLVPADSLAGRRRPEEEMEEMLTPSQAARDHAE